MSLRAKHVIYVAQHIRDLSYFKAKNYSIIPCGVPMEQAYKVLHFDEIQHNVAASVAMKTEKKVADSVRAKLQDFITEYRTNKARNDVEYYRKLTAEAKREYEKARQGYGSYADQNTDVVMQSYKLKESDLEKQQTS